MLVLAGGRVLDPATGTDEVADVVVDGDRVQRVGAGAGQGLPESTRVVDVSGCWVTPGLVDLHTHLREPGAEYKEDLRSGLRAAAAGGFTAVCPMPNTSPTNDTRAVTELIRHRQQELGGPRVYPFGAVTRGRKGHELTEMADLREGGAIGVSDDGRCVMNAATMRRALEYGRTFDLLVVQHCEDHDLTEGAQMHEGWVAAQLGLRGWPREAEDVIVARDLRLAELTGARYHVAHVSSLGTVRLLREAKSRGLPVSAEVTPHHLLLTDEAVVGYRTECKVNPPLGSSQDRAALREALADGTIDCIATDHAPQGSVDKDVEFEAAAVGIAGLETAVPSLLELVRNDVVSPLRLVEALSTAPVARLPDVEGGRLAAGGLADLTVIDPEHPWTVAPATLRSKSRNTPWLEHELQGMVRMTLVGGEVVFEYE